MIELRLGNRNIGDGYPCFIVFEAGPTHNGLAMAKQLVDHASEAGADAVKFQILDPDRLVADKKLPFSYDILLDRESGKTETVTEPLYDILCRRCLSPGEWRELKGYCDQRGIVFFSTVTFFDEVDFLADLGCDTLKICSGDIDYFQLIEYCAKRGFVLQFDSGNATIGDIERAVDAAAACGNQKTILHNCPSGYPARLESINLRLIPVLKSMFGCPVAFSDHTPGRDMDIAAVALGANMVEKTITLDRTTPSVEHLFSLEPGEMVQFVETIRDIETALGSSRRIMSPEEKNRALSVRRSLVLSRDAPAGTVLNESYIDFARPGTGIRPFLVEFVWNRKTRKDLKKDHILTFDDIL